MDGPNVSIIESFHVLGKNSVCMRVKPLPAICTRYSFTVNDVLFCRLVILLVNTWEQVGSPSTRETTMTPDLKTKTSF